MPNARLPKGSAKRFAYAGLVGLFLLVVLVISRSGAQVSAGVSSLVALYPMSNSTTNVLTDVSGNNINGTLANFNNPTFGTGPTQSSNSLIFSGNATATVDLSNTATSFSGFTFSTIYNSNSVITTKVPIASGTDALGNSWTLNMGTNGQPNLTLTDTKGNQQIVTGSNTNSLADGTYHSLVITLNSTTARLFTDNIAESVVTWAGGQAKQLVLAVTGPFTFSGREFDGETGLYYYRARYYNPDLGRFQSEDPSSFIGGDFNLFRSFANAPINFLDSFGLTTYEEAALKGATKRRCRICFSSS